MKDVITFADMVLRSMDVLRKDFGPREEFKVFERRASMLKTLAQGRSALVGPFLERLLKDLEVLKHKLNCEVREQAARLALTMALPGVAGGEVIN